MENKYCKLISTNEVVVKLADGYDLLDPSEVPYALERGEVFFNSVKKDGKEYNVYITKLSNEFFNGAKPLVGPEADVLEETFRKHVKRTPTLPGRL